MTNRFSHTSPWGTEITPDGVRFRLWAPSQRKLGLRVAKTGETLDMQPAGDGWFELVTDKIAPGEGYSFALENGMSVPDPAARAQVGDVHGPSKLIDPNAYAWNTPDWTGRPWGEAVLYETHTGTFSETGDFAGVARQLDRIAEAGITAVEILPVAQFAGNRGWGYDGVLHYAPHLAYGGPDALKALVDAAHARGLMILLDVVYNHFGPDGNYLHAYAADFFDKKRHTPWGPGIDFSRRPVRDFFLHNTLYWLEEYRFDGLRFDAIDQIADDSEEPILQEIARTVRETFPDRHIHLTSEDDSNLTTLLKFDAEGRPKLFTAEWNDDWHHAMHHLLTGEDDGFYEDYLSAPAARVARCEAEGFDYQGEVSRFRGGKIRGEASGHLPPTAFVDFLQNHDQTGNRPFGERLDALVDIDAVETGLSLLLLSPHIPLLFMGEEYAEESPFQYFTDFHGDLAAAVRKGRRNEFKKVRLFADPAARDRIPDPNAPETFEASRLKPDLVPANKRQRRETLIAELLGIRHRHIVPLLQAVPPHAGTIEAVEGRAIAVRWSLAEDATLFIAANFGETETPLPAFMEGAVLFERPAGAAAALRGGSLPPRSLVCRLVEGNARSER
ncbi:malto-oligosyltrehalose trehalohydrolase [Methyloligella sp. 2.7D]|uniref:malto-oligosyltrehalose trehalohydrolase n=1 Tax=unclassified Methyloligella TaxID=2625955 RepID=UPI00157E146A|nr:malto-oligosyltrehalose trehalohydrolase [Methyloligella sp. GL2]QKP76992.1 malto-oligosyltrehalose trehalohydrolase [Methyloligella sp. GL2]